MKRCLDVVISALLLAAFFPVGLLISLAILVTSPGPVFYRQERIGRGGKKFTLWKYRTMRMNQASPGPALTHGSKDPRITPLGYFLRRMKLDEFPQLFNVIKGEMSLVGPRPEVEKYVRLYNQEQRRVLQLRPGCTDITVVRGHMHDAALLEDQESPESYYINVLMPKKLQDNLYYLQHQSLWLDLKILFGTILLLMRLRKNQPSL
ncbi:MAG: sugar transferase [Acidobacteria bacterium]|nr:sugar transferase [Acidobacteriota bacterium]